MTRALHNTLRAAAGTAGLALTALIYAPARLAVALLVLVVILLACCLLLLRNAARRP